MYENIVIDDTSVYEIDEECVERCKEKEEEDKKKKPQSMELKLLIL